ncbi:MULTISPECIES: ComEC family protein [Lonsdalea]|uniref:Competence protein ComEC n=2 Tax=Lonsdalea TaxID=1082702 RepID=A0ACD1JD83_9GAMM|nr:MULTISPECIES: ComEC family protein [Lonsdalea]RAT14116.1 competence protein ComEC [Lonsdalea quercina]RAT18500.1 competence protein ComEC [Lonsdalea populi]RAT20495.1 competence protein ComEC [Lonsdalea populi]RAT27450.1 competence protein ComEC [Lonsdalea populi]RAT35610.1 competence protein ComEC [Lonsdalea populi]
MSLNVMALALVSGILPLLWLPQIPPASVLLGGMAALIPAYRYLPSRLRPLVLAVFALVWGCYNAGQAVRQTVDLTSRPVTADVAIASMRFGGLPDATPVVRLIRVDERWLFPPVAVRLNSAAALNAWCGGQRWRLRLQLRPVHSRLNEGGFDSQRWSLARRQTLTGAVLHATVLDARCGVRQDIVTTVEHQTQRLPWRSILLALTLGEMATVDDDTQALLRQTGTMHLMAISGLHIALAALFGWGLARGVQCLLPVHRIGYRFPLVVGLSAALCYVWLAGCNPPAVRAGLALSVWTLLRLMGVSCTPWQVWLGCVALILTGDPLSVLSDSFWLSSLAVAALIFWYQWAPLPHYFLRPKRWIWLRWLHLQMGMTLLLLPLQVMLFHGVSMTSLPANLWAVPLVSFVTTPLVLVALLVSFAPTFSAVFWWLADRSLTAVFAPLAALPSGWWSLGEQALPFSLSGWLAVAIWRFAWWRYAPLSVVSLLLILLLRPKAPAPLWRVDMLDVGHGVAVMIERNGKAVLYDTGARWAGGNMASHEIVPYLRWRGLELERIIVSHSHLDHSGGLIELQRQFSAVQVFSPMAQVGHQPCLQGQRWQWQGLSFSVLWPPRIARNAGNNDSCVVMVDDGRFRVLLTGDVEAQTEAALLRTQRLALAADILQVPHHGSATSSSPPFMRAVGAKWSASSNSRYNPWRLPSIKVRRRYRQMGYPWHDTATSGQLSVRFFSERWQVLGFRENISPRWYHRRFGVNSDAP